jgi:TolB protein
LVRSDLLAATSAEDWFMSQTKPITRRKLSAMAAGLLTCAGLRPATAANDIDGSDQRRFSIAVAVFSNDPPLDAPSWRDIAEAINSDLKASGRSVLIEPDSSVDESANATAVPRFDKWRSTHAEWLVTGRIAKSDHRLKVEYRLWNVVRGEHVLGEQYWTKSNDWRRVPDLIADTIIKRLTAGAD